MHEQVPSLDEERNRLEPIVLSGGNKRLKVQSVANIKRKIRLMDRKRIQEPGIVNAEAKLLAFPKPHA